MPTTFSSKLLNLLHIIGECSASSGSYFTIYRVHRSCWLEIANGYASVDDSSPSVSSPPLPPFPRWITQITHQLTQTASSTSSPSTSQACFLSLKDCMVAFFTVHMLLEQQKGSVALTILSTLEKIFPTSQILRSQVCLSCFTSSHSSRSHWRTMASEIIVVPKKYLREIMRWTLIVWSI